MAAETSLFTLGYFAAVPSLISSANCAFEDHLISDIAAQVTFINLPSASIYSARGRPGLGTIIMNPSRIAPSGISSIKAPTAIAPMVASG